MSSHIMSSRKNKITLCLFLNCCSSNHFKARLCSSGLSAIQTLLSSIDFQPSQSHFQSSLSFNFFESGSNQFLFAFILFFLFFFFRLTASASTPGRNEDTKMSQNFENLCNFFENEMLPMTTSEMHSKMIDLAGSPDEVYSMKQTKRKLELRYGGDIIIVQSDGRPNLACFKDTANFIIEKSTKDKEKDNLSECERIVKTAAKLIKAEIKAQKFNTEEYPSNKDIQCHQESLVPLLRLFMKVLISDELKQSSIGQAITKAVRPKSYIPPLLFGLGVEADHLFGSKWLTNELFKLGFYISPAEVTRFKHSIISSEENAVETTLKGSFTQWVADNVDHNICTLDGKDTFHGMGIIAAGTKERDQPSQDPVRIKRLKSLLTAMEISSQKKIPILWYEAPDVASLSKIVFKPVVQLQSPTTFSPSLGIDLLWHLLMVFNSVGKQPQWNGFMQEHQHRESHPPKSEIILLPIININPSDENCIYSTLMFIQNQARAMDVQTPSVTFDQPLWLKAFVIADSKNLDIVVRLGGFHTLMSFLGSLGTIMEGSGLERLLDPIYAKNSICHMMSGKAVARALRAHFLVESALTALLLEDLEGKYDQSDLEATYHRLVNQEITSEDVNEPLTITTLQQQLGTHKAHLIEQSRTSKLWIQYLYYVSVVKMFIRAERTGNWHEHLEAMRLMLNLFAATAHINYAKSARLYLQKMQSLQFDHPSLYEKYCKFGYHCIRRSDRFWADLWPDLVIERCMMRALKSRGGLIHGRGMATRTRDLWVSTMHECATVHAAMGMATNQHHTTSQQHIECGGARQVRDARDLKVIIEQPRQFNPFICQDSRLRCIFTGAVADESDGIDCDDAEHIGMKIQQDLDNLAVNKSVVKRSKQVKSLAVLRPGVQVNSVTIHVNPTVLFQRLIMLIERSEDMTSYFEYELTPEPTSLFKDRFMRKPNKALLGKALTKTSSTTHSEMAEATNYVLDGGALLHKVSWKVPSTYADVVQQYCDYVERKYGQNITVVLMGIDRQPKITNTKDEAK